MTQAKKSQRTPVIQDKKPELQHILDQAEADYNRAQEELYRPSMDVVHYSACYFARKSLHHYLYYCYKKFGGGDTGKPARELTIEQMARYCSRHDDRIARINFEEMHCRKADVLDDEEVFFCNDVDKVNSCKSLAEQMREIVYDMSSKS